jgi:biopolymer transport protein ExbD
MMRIGRIHKLISRGVGVLTFGLGLLASLIVSSLLSPPKNNSHVIAILMPAREWRPMLNPDERPFASNDFLIVQQSVESPSITEPITESQPEYDLIEHNCGTLTVYIDREGNLTLNTDNFGTLNDATQLTLKLREIFQQRIEVRAYLRGMENQTHLPMMERIPRTVLVRASRSLRYGDVLRIIEVLKEVGANPIGLQINDLPS